MVAKQITKKGALIQGSLLVFKIVINHIALKNI